MADSAWQPVDDAFVPPPLSSHQGPAFLPPPLSSHQAPAVDVLTDADIAAHDKQQAANWATDPIVGAFKGAASTLFHTGDLIRRGEQQLGDSMNPPPTQ